MDRPIRVQFAEDGYAVVRNLLVPSEVAFYISQLQTLAGDAAFTAARARPRASYRWRVASSSGKGPCPPRISC